MCGACKVGDLETGVPQSEVTPEMISAAIRAELADYFGSYLWDGPLLPERDVASIVRGVLQRVFRAPSSAQHGEQPPRR